MYEKLHTDYREKISEDDFNWIKNEIEILRKPDRTKSNVIKRKEIIKYLYNTLGMPFYKIGKLLRRDSTTVMHHFYN